MVAGGTIISRLVQADQCIRYRRVGCGDIDVRRTAIDDNANAAAMRLAEGHDAKELAKAASHEGEKFKVALASCQ